MTDSPTSTDVVLVAPESIVEAPKLGRPTKYTPERVELILTYLRQGNTRKTAGRASGISHETFSQWLREHPDFSEQVTQAEQEAVAKAVEMVLSAAFKGQWGAAAWWLERRHPQEWGKVDRLELYAQVREWARGMNLDEEEVEQQARQVLKEIRSASRQ